MNHTKSEKKTSLISNWHFSDFGPPGTVHAAKGHAPSAPRVGLPWKPRQRPRGPDVHAMDELRAARSHGGLTRWCPSSLAKFVYNSCVDHILLISFILLILLKLLILLIWYMISCHCFDVKTSYKVVPPSYKWLYEPHKKL